MVTRSFQRHCRFANEISPGPSDGAEWGALRVVFKVQIWDEKTTAIGSLETAPDHSSKEQNAERAPNRVTRINAQESLARQRERQQNWNLLN